MKKKGDRKSVVAPARVIRTYTHTGSVISWALSQFRWVRKNGGKEGQYDEIKTYHAVESWNRHVVVHFFESQFDFGSNKIKCSFQLFSTDVTLSTLFASHLHTQINNSINCPTIAKTRSQLNLKQVEMKNFSRSDVNRRRDAMDAPKQMILSFPSFCSFFFYSLPSSSSFPPSCLVLSRHVTRVKERGGPPPSVQNIKKERKREMATVRWLEEQQAVGIRPPPPHMYITLFFSSFFFTTLFRRLIINPLTSLFFFLARSFYPVEGRKLERCKFYFNLKTNLIKIRKN